MVFFRAEDDAYGGVIILPRHGVFIEPDIHIHLSDILMGELAGLEVNEYKAFWLAASLI